MFVHLRLHSEFSVVDGTVRIDDAVAAAASDGQPAMALTDLNNMFGAVKFYKTAQKKGVQPILGAEVMLEDLLPPVKDRPLPRVLLLAQGHQGYLNLCELLSRGWIHVGNKAQASLRWEWLQELSDDLIMLSGAQAGPLGPALLAGDPEQAHDVAMQCVQAFPNRFYLELQRAGRSTDEPHVIAAMQLAQRMQLPVVATHPIQFQTPAEFEAHEARVCIAEGEILGNQRRPRHFTEQQYFHSSAQMQALFADIPSALENTVEIAKRTHLTLTLGKAQLPDYPIPDGLTMDEYFRQLSFEGLEQRLQHLYPDPARRDAERPRYVERLEFELGTIINMGFPGYFLIVQDFIRAAREELDVSVGPGRGSAAGSAVAYCLGITQIDPIAYDLLFERFLNPDRISLPDIDVDFDDDGRGRVLNWVTQKYGKEKVAHIITYGTMATKLAIKDVARVQKLMLSESDRLCKLVPDKIPDKKLNLQNAIDYVPELKAAEQSDNPILRDTIRYAKMLEGNVRNTGVHACGTIICRDDITDWVPVSTADDKETGEKMLVTQYEGSVIEDTGLIKMDFLGLKTLSIIKDAVENIRLTKGVKIDIDDFTIINDPATYRLYGEGRTVGTFQFESAGMQKYLRELQPSTFEDLIAMNALYRPGPMDYIPDFIARKHGRSPIEYDIPVMEKYLKDTYGITVYQEQVMLLSRLLANFTRGESDTLRKAMGKKLKDKLDHLKPKFIEGGRKNGHDPKVLEKIWGDWEKFASYAFNKSHATCYSWVAYQTAYLKANYPSEYMAAVLSRNLTNIEQLTLYMNECKRMGISVMGPDINESMRTFSSNAAGDVRFGLAAVKGVGAAAVESIIAERKANGPFKDIYDFVERVNYSLVNRKCLENLAYAGAFDSISDFARCKYFGVDLRDSSGITFIEQLMRYGQRFQTEQNNAQQSLFGGGEHVDIQRPVLPACADWSQLEKLTKEREMVGLYLSAHPLDDYKIIIDHMCKTQLSELENLDALKGQEIAVAGMVVGVQNLMTKTGKPWGKFKLEDYNGGHEFALFGKDYENFRKYLFPDYFLFVRGRVQAKPYNDKELEFKIISMVQLQEMRDTIKEMIVQLPIEEVTEAFIHDLTERVRESKGDTLLRLNVYDRGAQVSLRLFSKSHKVSLSQSLVGYLDDNSIHYSIA